VPFKSEAQRRHLWAKHPEIAQRWADEAHKKVAEALVKRKRKKHG
jgi:hypothetical protein